MSVEILQTGDLTPQQVLVGCLNDELENIEAVLVCRITKDGLYIWSHSQCNTAERALALVCLQRDITEDAFS
jgi:hypothetical protein